MRELIDLLNKEELIYYVYIKRIDEITMEVFLEFDRLTISQVQSLINGKGNFAVRLGKGQKVHYNLSGAKKRLLSAIKRHKLNSQKKVAYNE